MSNSALRIESARYSMAAEPCGTDHLFDLKVVGISYPEASPEIISESSGARYIAGAPIVVEAHGCNVSNFFELGEGLIAASPKSKGMAVEGPTFARPEDGTKKEFELDEEIAEAVREVVANNDFATKSVTLLDKYAIVQAIEAIRRQNSHPQSYEMFVIDAIGKASRG